jgi:hypothetical protein
VTEDVDVVEIEERIEDARMVRLRPELEGRERIEVREEDEEERKKFGVVTDLWW